ncbi:MAG: hypothetical protein PVG17_16575 [Desulfobacterales bacterium]|jgi:hypothetical protein
MENEAPVDTGKTEIPAWLYTLFAWVMIGHFIYILGRCFLRGTPADVFWISHVGTLIGGLGALFRSRLVISIALVSLLGHHLFWLIDTLLWIVTGDFPFGTTTYLKDATLWDWLQSSNHFFSVPALLFLAYWLGGVERNAWIWSTILFATLTFISAAWLPAEANVNSAHRLWPGLEQLHLAPLEQLPRGWYPIIVVALNGLGNYLPANLLLRGLYHYLFKLKK